MTRRIAPWLLLFLTGCLSLPGDLLDPDGDGVDYPEDCDGSRDDVNPNTPEVWFDGIDNDCDPRTLDRPDDDEDGFDALADCDDKDAAIHPGAQEVCDGLVDEDCDGLIDDADDSTDSASKTTWYADEDGDGYGDPSTAGLWCVAPQGGVLDDSDCDDTRAEVNPGAVERCDAEDRDEDCDGMADDLDNSTSEDSKSSYYPDADGDGYGDLAGLEALCDPREGDVEDSRDCDDTRADIYPGAEERCDAEGLDEDCDGLADDADDSTDRTSKSVYYLDEDGDGFGDPSAAGLWCLAPDGGVSDGSDCDDTRSEVYPGAEERCDAENRDEDCDGLADDLDGSTSEDSKTNY